MRIQAVPSESAFPSASDPPEHPAIGTLVGGKYRIVRLLGEGGMGAVYEAENTLTWKRVALKWLHPRLSTQPSAQQRLLREARATSRIRHPSVVDLYDVIQEDDAVVLIMELLSGQLLSHRIADGPMQLWQLVRILLDAMAGVMAAHEVGVVHRDVKPDNIFLSELPDGSVRPKVIDFGIAMTAGAELARLTESGMAVGTPRYVSYEQLRGEDEPDARCDVYAFGVILYEAMLGRAPYEGRTLGEQAVQFVTVTPASPATIRPDLPHALVDVVQAAIARERVHRLSSLDAMARALAPYARPEAYARELLVWPRGGPLPEDAAGVAADTQPSGVLAPPRASVPNRARAPARASAAAVVSIALSALCWWALPETPRAPAQRMPAQRMPAQPIPAETPAGAQALAMPAQDAALAVQTELADASVRPRTVRKRNKVMTSQPGEVPEPQEPVVHRAGPVSREEF
jgi:tRNA A-37 threonylcarbamoyl transferase component Bud32